MKEIKILGRGGQGVVSASAVLASAFYLEGYHSHAFPMYGIERRGGPARSFVRVDKKEIIRHDQVYSPFVMLVVDLSVLKEEIEKELKTVGLMIVNTTRNADEIKKEFKLKDACIVKTLDATKIALEATGKPFANVALIGALAGATNMVSLDSLNLAVAEIWADKGATVIQSNQLAIKKAYDLMRCEKCRVEI